MNTVIVYALSLILSVILYVLFERPIDRLLREQETSADKAKAHHFSQQTNGAADVRLPLPWFDTAMLYYGLLNIVISIIVHTLSWLLLIMHEPTVPVTYTIPNYIDVANNVMYNLQYNVTFIMKMYESITTVLTVT